MGKKGNQAAKDLKKAKQAAKANKKNLKDLGEEVLIQDLVKQLDNASASKPTEVIVTGPPSARTSFSLLGAKGSIFYIYGGEYFDSKTCNVFRDLYKWTVGKDKEDPWKLIKCNPEPKPRCGHQAIINQDEILVFGGEFATASQFYHFKDFWRFDLKSQTWSEIDVTGTPPSARSGHRMVMCRNLLVLFGGFHDSGRETRYFNDIYVYERNHWRKIVLPASAQSPCARSGVVMAADNNGVLVYGGYSKTRDTDRSSQGVTHQDTWWLDLTPVFDDPKSGVPTWERIGRRGPLRNGCGVATQKNNVYVFGGVLDDDQGGLTIKDSLFFNDVAVFDLVSRKWTYLTADEETQSAKAADSTVPELQARIESFKTDTPKAETKRGRVGFICFRGKIQKVLVDPSKPFENSVDLSGMSKRERLEYEKTRTSHGLTVLDEDFNWKVHPKKLNAPMPRYGASVSVKDNYLYVFGGSLEIEKATIVLDDCWKIRVGGKKSEWSLVLPGTYWEKEWEGVESSDEDSSGDETEGSGSESDDSESRESDEESCESDKESRESDDEVHDMATRLRRVESAMGQRVDADYIPRIGEALKDFYKRTQSYWEHQVKNHDSLDGKEIRKLGFTLAEQCFKAVD
eukprot:Blabericola_migrator_1__2223@NODE_1613_length_4167_cov_397_112683_g1046_i1_p1_GENE_NODE_1613_length_4167_cov_397_112683_g1046_i1NODE_1613_length_4167_cov_397_112683_g1046_i1_p1_ORF_typecomplete_len627_score149_96Kelch_4/PF13418_6/16Kelch_4/PF13418_6/1_4e09Kelch_4/PF13418_6/6_8e08Kelch_4/PF13418_6/0_028Kelch_4/PF13418_6/5_6e07Kelch_4/PF13418_6/7_9e03Kelch_4/PF13418_6/0_0027Kelch_6/PF13964_6/1_3e02Kelch_6/PF13964_6/5_2e12Kelch_6/PF13964_6/5_1e06Kelch_6/PF13964_6/0_028Kelch_6/PF13964_6/1_3e06Kelch_